MYSGATVPTERPKRANRNTYREFAQRSSWHIEEAASLLAGYIPRRTGLKYRPYDDAPSELALRQTAQTWGQLFAGEIGTCLALYERARESNDWDFSAVHPYVKPLSFIEFCDRSRTPIPRDLRESVMAGGRSRPSFEKRVERKSHRQSVAATRQALYKSHVNQIASDLAKAEVRVTARELLKLVESRVHLDRTIIVRTFQGYIGGWRRERAANSQLKKLLKQVLFQESGRPSEEQIEKQKAKMPRDFAKILWPTLQTEEIRK